MWVRADRQRMRELVEQDCVEAQASEGLGVGGKQDLVEEGEGCAV